ncbi:hypothetical protein SAMN02745163_00965 [Clostridium cavendishii DSM 21758]|uniref:Uncharacterized protein n=1 Tax=Clostridium cavendishii DSM 21758 TaxID=1121302 RepID=A0A1M6EWH1_9CLOT|nr:hypothetical protein [Clostridium cavendishii]SHI89770.1 hypothetical protein SAMN02745163_00965 [Clostridium cavendishii DSM 21758]
MKIGIDINNQFIRLNLKYRLKKINHVVVDFSEINAASLGERLYKKSIMANQIKVDLFINITTIENFQDEFIIFSKLQDQFVINIEKELKKFFNSKKVSLRDGAYLYIIKNIKATAYIINIPKNLNYDESLGFANCIYDSIIKQ